MKGIGDMVEVEMTVPDLILSFGGQSSRSRSIVGVLDLALRDQPPLLPSYA